VKISEQPTSYRPTTRETIMRAVVGSTLYGLSVSDVADRDEMGICIEPWTHFFGLRGRFEQHIERTKPDGERSGPGDLDRVTYSLAKWARLALDGNPTILQLLFIPEHAMLIDTDIAKALRALAPCFIGENIFAPHLGYMRQQRTHMHNRSGHGAPRPELVEKYGFDTKYAGHMLRLGYQGIELAETGRLTFPMPEPQRQHILDVRTGKYSMEECLKDAEQLETRLLALRDSHALGKPDVASVEAFVVGAYMAMHPRT
jgi:predicted nucleotidyltransferase